MPWVTPSVLPYITSYFAVGLFFAASALLHGTFARDKRISASAFTILLWPVVVLFAPDGLFRGSARGSHDTALKSTIASQLDQHEAEFWPDERRRLQRLAESYAPGVARVPAGSEALVLRAFWDEAIPPSVYYDIRLAQSALVEQKDDLADSGIRFSRAGPEWYLGFSTEFIKSITGIDRKLQGRILEAISRIGAAPLTPVGDTIKPLTADMTGIWRYRIGDSRLLYRPDQAAKQVTLLSFSARGSAYG